MRLHHRARLGACDDRHDLERHAQAAPLQNPGLDQPEIVAAHELETAREIGLDPAVEMLEALRQRPTALIETTVDRDHVVVAEPLDHHEQRLIASRPRTGPPYFIGSGGGCPSIFGRSGSKHAQSGADLCQMIAEGRARFGSSSAPARTKMACGRLSASLKTCVPHRAQKRRCMIAPLSAVDT